MRFPTFIYYFSLVVFSALILLVFFSAAGIDQQHPGRLLNGTWKEVAWTYEKVNHQKGLRHRAALSEEVRDDITQGLYIHRSETWIFSGKNQLTLHKPKATDVNVKWSLKGRGHILKLKYPDRPAEYYQIRVLSDSTLVLHFENDTHARGIVKIELKKH